MDIVEETSTVCSRALAGGAQVCGEGGCGAGRGGWPDGLCGGLNDSAKYSEASGGFAGVGSGKPPPPVTVYVALNVRIHETRQTSERNYVKK